MNLNALDHLKLLKLSGAIASTRIALMSISYLARFARPGFLKPFKLATSEYDVFIQQQVDPMDVEKNTIHVVRLHDFLPVTHPQLFDQNAVKIFTKSLRIMLKGKKKIWVMDSESTAKDFKEYFGEDLDVRVIPCSITPAKSGGSQFIAARKNQICVVNTIEPRKRVSLAISGFREAKSMGKLSPDWELIIIGAEGWQEKNLASGLRKGVFGGDIIFKENATDFELQQVFSESKIVLSAAAAEGFGLPPLEGMINGCVPVVSDIPQHRETVRENGFYFSGENPEGIANALGEAAALVADNDSQIAKNLRNYVEENYSEEVIGKMWGKFINSLAK
jgi:glycosyltransferase involved in cell wall biosynthesis